LRELKRSGRICRIVKPQSFYRTLIESEDSVKKRRSGEDGKCGVRNKKMMRG
jgi:hypothetical protein